MSDPTAIVVVEPTGLVEAGSTEDHSGAVDDEQLVWLWVAGKATSTQKAYVADAKRLLNHLGGVGRCLRSATLANIQDYVQSLGGAITTQARKVASMKSLLAFAYRTGYTRFDVGRVIVAPKVPNDLAERILGEEQVIRMIAVASSRRDRVLLRLLYVGGLRVSEAEGLRWRHLHDRGDGCIATVHGKGGKTRHVLLTDQVATELQALRGGAADEAPVFRSRTDRPLGRRDMQRVVRKFAKAAGIDLAVSPHWMRHAHASHALDRGAPIHLVQQDLGHASVATTSKYLHARPDDGSARYLPA